MSKETWQETQAEYVEGVMERAQSLRQGYWKGNKLTLHGASKADLERTRTKGAPEAHRYFVELALKQGKPVPAEVLKDYPDLKPELPKTKAEFDASPYWSAKQREFTDRMEPYQAEHEAEIKKVNDAFMAGKMSLKEMNDAHDRLRQRIDNKADRVRAEMGFPTSKPQSQVVVVSKYKGDQLKAIHAYYDDMEDGHLDYKRPVSNRKPRITPRMPKLR